MGVLTRAASLAVDDKKAKDPEGGARNEKAVAHLLRIQDADFRKVSDVAHEFVIDLGKWQNDLKFYVDAVRAKKHEPDSAVLMQFDQRKVDLIDAAVQRLKTTLSPQSWAGLHIYINEEHRLHTRVFEFKAQP